MLQKAASQWASLIASRRAVLKGVQMQHHHIGSSAAIKRTSPLVLSSSSTLLNNSRGYATSAVAPETDGASPPVHSTPPPKIKTTRLTNLGRIEAAWAGLPRTEQERIYTELQELQKKDWKELTLDEKKAAYYISYGPHGPRAPIVPPNTNGKVFLGVVASIVAAASIFGVVRMNSRETPKTLTKEWKDASTEIAKEQKMDPFTGPARADGAGKRF